MLGTLFITYLVGAVLSPMAGRMIARFGRRSVMLATITVWASGAVLTLATPVATIIAGLILCAACGMLCQTVTTSHVTTIVRVGRSSAVGLYVTSFYAGGSMGAFLPGWPGARAGGRPAS
jgi:MFS family permease